MDEPIPATADQAATPPTPPTPPTPALPPQVVYQVVQPIVRPTNGLAVAALVLGIIGVLIPFLGIVALIFGGLGLSKTNHGASGKGMAIAGLVLGILETLLTLAAVGQVGAT